MFSVGDNSAQRSSGGNTRRHITPATSAEKDINMTAPRRKTSAPADKWTTSSICDGFDTNAVNN